MATPPSAQLPADVSPLTTQLPSQHSSQSILPPDEQVSANFSLDHPRRPSPATDKLSAPRIALGTIDQPGDPSQSQQDYSPAPRPSLLASSNSAPVGRLPRLLPYDASLYSDATIPIATSVHSSTTSLSELAHIVRLQKYQEQRRSQLRVKLHRWLVSAAVSARLLHCGELVHRSMIENFRQDERTNFTRLYNAIHDVRASCDATRRYAMLEPEFDNEKRKATEPLYSSNNNFSTFMHEIPQRTRNEFLAFIDELRTNPDFLATRLASLSQSELSFLLTFRPPLDPRESVMAAATSAASVKKAPTSNPVERLLSFHRHDPLSSLVYTIFANTSGPDSAEDLRRTDIWATACARLIIDGRPGGEPVIRSILDLWAGMRGWSAKTNFELYLMEILQDGQFILDRWEAHGTRQSSMQMQMTDKELDYLTEDFLDRSVKKLFDVIDDEVGAVGLPDGALEIGTSIMRKLNGHPKKMRQAAETVIIHRWFFATYLRNALIWPESCGIMVGYHVSQKARETILKEIAFRAQRQAQGMELELAFRQKQMHIPIDKGPQLPPVIPEVKAHMENILAYFRHPRPSNRPLLQPAKSVTSPRETAEVQPFLLICPSDILTLVSALFPERRQASGQYDLDAQRRGIASSGSSISGMSIPIRHPQASTPGDGSSILSASASSITSGTTSREPLIQPVLDFEQENQGRTTNLEGHPIRIYCPPSDDYGKRLRAACAEMTRALGVDATAGSCHPCAERWAVIYVGQEGQGLRTRMRKDSDDDDDTEEDSFSSDDDDGSFRPGLELESDYHQMKADVLRLLQEYEVPKNLVPESESKALSNRTTHRAKARNGRRGARGVGLEDPRSLPLTHSNIATLLATERGSGSTRPRLNAHVRAHSANEIEDQQKSKASDLVIMLEAAYQQCSSRNDWLQAQRWYRAIEQLRKLSTASLTFNGFALLLNFFARGPREALSKACSAIEEFEAWFAWLKQSLDRYDSNLEEMMLGFKNLRDKMWYKTAVLTSASYDEAKNVAVALRMMDQLNKGITLQPTTTQRTRSASKPNNNFLLKTGSQVLELMTANETAGPNKLADEQADLTSQWLKRCGVENLCKGEERIHRFCYEIDKCVNKLVGDSILDGPVLWSSELYNRDKTLLNDDRKKGDLFLMGVGTLSLSGDEDHEPHGRPGPMSLDFVKRPAQNSSPRSLTSRPSQQSLDSARWSIGSRSINLMDSPEYFGIQNAALTIDASQTFWSPFQPHSATTPTSPTIVRPNTSSSSRSTIVLKSTAAINSDKRKFLLDLKQTLTGMLLSDLGSILFPQGSETDAWFGGDLGQECAMRKEQAELAKRRRLARKKSLRAMRSAKNLRENVLKTEKGNAPVVQDANLNGDQSSSSEATARSAGMLAAKKAGLFEFPYNVAFRRILARFATHPNPFAKLHSLWELELLIVSSLTARSTRGFSRKDALPAVPPSPTLGSTLDFSGREAAVPVQPAQNIEDSIANATSRREYSMNQQQQQQQQQTPGRVSPLKSSGSGTRPSIASTDMIVEVLQSLFRDADVRPKTLFRDLQYIAALVPASMLDRTERGKAFWDTTLAALGLKQDYVRYLVEIADDIVAESTEKRTVAERERNSATNGGSKEKPAVTSKTAFSDGATDPAAQVTPISKFTMADAARMFTITAKEGDAVAQRELAIMYMTHPDLLPRTLLPLSKPREVFKGISLPPSSSGHHSGGRASRAADDRERDERARADPVTLTVALHWMGCSKMNGDELAGKYLKDREDMENIK